VDTHGLLGIARKAESVIAKHELNLLVLINV